MKFFYVIEIDSKYLMFGVCSSLTQELGRLSIEFKNGFYDLAVFKTDLDCVGGTIPFEDLCRYIRGQFKNNLYYETDTCIYSNLVPREQQPLLERVVIECMQHLVNNGVKIDRVAIGNPDTFLGEYASSGDSANGLYNVYRKWCNHKSMKPIINHQNLMYRLMQTRGKPVHVGGDDMDLS